MARPLQFLLCLGMLALSISANAGSTGSLFSTQFKWTDDQGKALRLEEFRGKWTILSMMYTSCPSSCPLIVQKMRKIESQMSTKGLKADFVLVTFDPERDTPAKLKTHRAKISVTEKNWYFLSGSAAETRRLSMLLGIKFAKDPESGEFMHDNKIILVSPTGEIKARLNSLGENDSDLIEAMTIK
mgnify:CR=1 FL=1